MIDPVDAGFPSVRAVVRTYREVWKTRKTGKRDKFGRDIRRPFGKPTKVVAWHVSSLDPDSQAGRAKVFQRNGRLEKERSSLPNENVVRAL